MILIVFQTQGTKNLSRRKLMRKSGRRRRGSDNRTLKREMPSLSV